MNKRHYEHTLPNIRGSLSNTYEQKRGKSSGADHIREISTLTLNNSQRQAKHVASITPDKKEKKQLII